MVKLEVVGAEEAAKEIGEAADRAANLQPAMVRGAQEIDALIRERFATGTDARGQAWAPLAASTTKQRGFGGKPLSALAATVFARADGNTIVFGSTHPHARQHQFGTGTIPPRPFLPVRRKRGGVSLIKGKGTPVGAALDRLFKAIANFIVRGKAEP